MTTSATAPAPGLPAMLDGLIGQWVEETFLDPDGRTRIVTSRGSTITTASASMQDHVVSKHDFTVLGRIITATRLDSDGSWSWVLMHLSGAPVFELTISAPWTLRGLCGEGAAATAVGQIGYHAPRGHQFATPEALAAWAERPHSDLDRALLDDAEDDWLDIADVVSHLVGRGVTEADQILHHGIDTTAGLLARADLVAGMIGDDGFEATTETIPEVIERIATTWVALGGLGVGLGSICWLALPDGDAPPR